MNATKAFAAHGAATAPEPWILDRRNPKPHDVAIEILFLGGLSQ